MENPPKYLAWGYCALFALLPCSVEMPLGAARLTVPAEPLTLALGIGLAWHFWKKRPPIAPSMLLKISVLWLFWQALAAAFSTLPIVSAKHFVVEAGQWWVFFGGMVLWPRLWSRALPFLLAAMVCSAVFALWQHSFFGFRPDQSNLAPMPFFADHTIFSATLAMLLSHFLLEKNRPRALWLLGFGLAAAAIYFSFCRAAWLSVAAAGGLAAVFFGWKKWRWMLAGALVLTLVAVFFREKFSEKMAALPVADGNARSVGSQLRSLANFTTDASNLERLNRYACARRMVADRPLAGFGPGTFQFQYLAYQRPEEMTRISVTQPITDRKPSNYGRGGGAHSEYFQAMAETGWPGFLCWLALVFAASAAAARAFFRAQTPAARWAALAILASLTTFFVHGLVNNFLHDGRVAALFWGQLAVLVRWPTVREGLRGQPLLPCSRAAQ